MHFFDLLGLAAQNLRRRKGRTLLTILGVVIGTCAVIIMISLGLAQNRSTEEMLQSWGDLTQIDVYANGITVQSGSQKPAVLDTKTLDGIKRIRHVRAVTPFYNPNQLQGRLAAGRNGRYQSDLYDIYGVLPDALEEMGLKLANGQWLNDKTRYAKDTIPVLVGSETAFAFHDSRRNPRSRNYQRSADATDALGNPQKPFFEIGRAELKLILSDGDEQAPKTVAYRLEVVGTLEQNDNLYWTRSGIVMRMQDVRKLEKAYRRLLGEKDKSSDAYDSVRVKVDQLNQVETVEKEIQALGFSTSSMAQIRKDMQKQIAQQQMILGGLAAVSLLVAALNIANTMTMAIYERTKEIGVMKVLGCSLGDIRAMFLLESGMIGLLGGLVGSVFSMAVSYVLNHAETLAAFLTSRPGADSLSALFSGLLGGGTTISLIHPALVLFALAFAAVIGVLSGILPAGRAVKISSLEALRHG